MTFSAVIVAAVDIGVSAVEIAVRVTVIGHATALTVASAVAVVVAILALVVVQTSVVRDLAINLL